MKSTHRHSEFRLPHHAFPSPQSPVPSPRRRRGFTLVELMVVVVIIGILAALIVPAIRRAVIAANEGRVIVEINGLSTAIATFKNKYGTEPPSQIVIFLSGNQANATGWYDPANAAYMATIRGIWPQFDFTMGAGAGTTFPAFWQNAPVMQTINGSPAVVFHSGEALLFCLGGVIDQPNSAAGQAVSAPTGFAKSPKWPFSPKSIVTNREGPFFEFSDIARIRDIDGNGINEWYDQLSGQTKPYLYFSSYDGQGYRLSELPSNGTNFGIYTASGTVHQCLHDFYRVSSNAPLYQPLAVASAVASTSADPTLTTAQKPQSFQIISPGYDTEYGSGGVFNPNLPNSGLVGYDASNNQISPDTFAFDNLTNFNSGRLKP